MPLIEPVIRPPSEARSFLLHVTVGCSSNSCTFCSTYKRKKFNIQDKSIIYNDIASGSKLHPGIRRVFLLDGDALAAPAELLFYTLQQINIQFKQVTRIASYANGSNIAALTDSQLKELKRKKLSRIYIGLESGSRKVLERCGKGSSATEMVTALERCRDAGIKSSVMVLLGLGGKELSSIHIRDTVKILNQMQPDFLSFLSLMLIPGTPLYDKAAKGKFQKLTQKEILKEEYEIIKGLELKKTVFRSDHISNHIPLSGRFPNDKIPMLQKLKAAMKGII